MILPNRNLWAAEEDILACFGDGMLLLDLYFDDVRWMLNDFADVGLVATTNLPHDTFCQVDKTTPHPVLIEDTSTETEWSVVSLDHAESSVDRPEDEEDDKEVMGVPESLVVFTARLLD